MARVFIVDDHQVFGQALQMALDMEADLEVVGMATDGLSAAREAARLSPDVVIMDYRLPDVNGAVAAQAIKECCPAARVVMLTSYTDVPVLTESLRAGVCGFLSKDKALSEVVEAVRLAAAGETQIPPAVLRSLLSRLEAESAEMEYAVEGVDHLTAREIEVLQVLATGADQDGISERLGISPNTVRTHLQRVLGKLGVHSRLEAVSLAIRMGLIRPPL